MRQLLLTGALLLWSISSIARTTETLYLSGKGNEDPVEWDFFCTAGRNSGKWTRIGVPSNWELQGFGQFTYGHMKAAERLNESGIYRRSFDVPASWRGKKVSIVFCGVMTDTRVTVNGKSAGDVHQGGFYEFSYDISRLLKYGGKNRIEVKVDKSSSDRSVVGAEREADFWVFGGIYRPVYLEASPAVNIGRLAIDARADASLKLCVELSGDAEGCRLEAEVKTPDGKVFGKPFGAAVSSSSVTLETVFDKPRLWSAEFPNLYVLELKLVRDGKTIHSVSERFGFRTVEVRAGDGIYLNGEKIRFRGVDRHSHWPTSGRTLSDRINLQDALLIKEMNMNAVRMSHYPPEKRFLELCDSLGLYVIDELTGWQSAYDTEVGHKLVRELVLRDRNHPSVLLWANGNEGGFNFELKEDYPKWDIQKRTVIHPWLDDSLVCTFHYPSWNSVRDYLCHNKKVWFPTEFIHGLYDGGHGAGLEDFWKLMVADPLCAGGFLWDLVDQAVVRDDEGGRLDTDGNHGADGILGPFRQKEGSYYAIRDIWCPVQLEGRSFLPATFDGRLTLENRYSFTNLSQCSFSAAFCKLDFPGGKTEILTVPLASPDVAPGMRGVLRVPVPSDFSSYDVMKLKVSGPDGKEIMEWTRNITPAASYAASLLGTSGKTCTAVTDGSSCDALKTEGRTLPLSGLRITGPDSKDAGITVTNRPDGWVEVEYSIRKKGFYDNAGVTFDFPEDKILGMRWLGNGPYRVWSNRLRGMQFGIWEKKYNDSATGESWEYPEFKGYHSNMYAADIRTAYGILRMVFASDDLFLRILTPSAQKNRNNDNTLGVFPDGQISVLNVISAVGTKFKKAAETGPSGQKTWVEYNTRRQAVTTGRFYMKFIPE